MNHKTLLARLSLYLFGLLLSVAVQAAESNQAVERANLCQIRNPPMINFTDWWRRDEGLWVTANVSSSEANELWVQIKFNGEIHRMSWLGDDNYGTLLSPSTGEELLSYQIIAYSECNITESDVYQVQVNELGNYDIEHLKHEEASDRDSSPLPIPQNGELSSPSLYYNNRDSSQPPNNEVSPILLPPLNEPNGEPKRVFWQLGLESPETLRFLKAKENQELQLTVGVRVSYQELPNEKPNPDHTSPTPKPTPIAALKVEEIKLQTTEQPALSVKFTNAGPKSLTDCVLQLSLDEAPLGESLNRKLIAVGETVILVFNLSPTPKLEPNSPSSVVDTAHSEADNIHPETSPDSLHLPSGYQYILLALTIVVFSIMLYYLYRHPIVETLPKYASGLFRIPLPSLPKVRLLLWLTRRLNGVLSDSGVPATLFNEAVGFLKKSPAAQATILANRLGTNCEAIPTHPPLKKAKLFRLHLPESFPLNLKSCLLYLPATRLPVADILNQLRQREEFVLQKVVIIVLNETQLQALRPYGEEAANLWIVPNHLELTQWLLAPNPVQPFGWMLAAQLKLTQISPYQTRGGVNKDTVFFGRTHILDHILNRAPANYSIYRLNK